MSNTTKPWEQAGGTPSGSAPFKPPSPGSTSDIVEASGTAKPGEVVIASNRNPVNQNYLSRPLPTRPWEQQTYGTPYGGYNPSQNYNSSYSYGSYGPSYGGYGGGLLGNTYRSGYGMPFGGGMYGGGMYSGGIGGPVGSYGMGTNSFVDHDPNNPYGPPSSPPGFWISFLRVMQGVVNFFGRIAILIDQNTQAFHMFMSALLQLFDRTGLLYGELARFVLRLLGIRIKPSGQPPQAPSGDHKHIEAPKAANSWEKVWGDNTAS